MKLILLTVLLLLPAFAAGQAASDAKDTRTKHTDPVHLFSLDYSDKWTKMETDDPSESISLVHLSEAGSVEALFIVIVQYDAELKDLTPEDFANLILDDPEKIKSDARETNETANAIEFGKTQLAGRPAYRVKFRLTENTEGVTREFTRYENSVLVDGRVYMLMFQVETAADGKWTAEREAIVSSFAVSGAKPENDK